MAKQRDIVYVVTSLYNFVNIQNRGPELPRSEAEERILNWLVKEPMRGRHVAAGLLFQKKIKK